MRMASLPGMITEPLTRTLRCRLLRLRGGLLVLCQRTHHRIEGGFGFEIAVPQQRTAQISSRAQMKGVPDKIAL